MKTEFYDQLTTAIYSCPIVYIPHFHYTLLDETLEEIVSDLDLSLANNIIEYDIGQQNVVDFKTKKLNDDLPDYKSPVNLLKDIVIGRFKGNGTTILVLKNFNEFLRNVEIIGLLSQFASLYERGEMEDFCTIIIMSPNPVTDVPSEINRFITVVDVKAPDDSEIMELVNAIPVSNQFKDREKRLRQSLCQTLLGLQMYEVKQIIRTALINGNLSDATIEAALTEKKNIVKKTGVIEVKDPNVSFDEVGGLDILKKDLMRKAVIYRNLTKSDECNIKYPKGILIVGMPGCGKTMIAKSIANKFGVSLLRLDLTRLMGKYYGESETNLRIALATAEAAHPCVLWIDEIEKAFAGTNGQNNDNLVMRLMGHFLTWMQERESPVYIVATANDVMRPEFMRKGRFDEVYFVDFPTAEEREIIFDKKIAKYRDARKSVFDFSSVKDYKRIVGDSHMKGEYGGFSGAEIESIVNTVIEKKFIELIERQSNGEKIEKIRLTENDFIAAAEEIKDSVMANQKSEKDKETGRREKTNIERIIDMQEKYQFKRATNNKK